MPRSSKTLKYQTALTTVAAAVKALESLPADPTVWDEQQRETAEAAILTLGAPESFLRRFARAGFAA